MSVAYCKLEAQCTNLYSEVHTNDNKKPQTPKMLREKGNALDLADLITIKEAIS